MPCCLAIGNFDGVHLGHRALLERVVAGARALGVGSDLVNLKAVDAGQAATITEAAKSYLQIIAAARVK